MLRVSAVLAAVGLLSACANQAPSSASAPPPPGTGAMTGDVTDPGSRASRGGPMTAPTASGSATSNAPVASDVADPGSRSSRGGGTGRAASGRARSNAPVAGDVADPGSRANRGGPVQ
ncbi:hypothetical protein [Muricoccus roseus]|nr:hypothetical protein [Roseomonas rosea]